MSQSAHPWSTPSPVVRASAALRDAAPKAMALNGLRIAAAALVIVCAAAAAIPQANTALQSMLDWRWLAADLFVLLSGHVLGRAHGPALEAALDAPDRTWRGLLRLWPAHLMLLGALTAGASAVIVSGATPVRAWSPAAPEALGMPMWGMAALMLCYALFPVAWKAMRALQGRYLALAAAAAGLLAAAGASGVVLGGASLFDPSATVVRIAPLFVVGLLTARFAAGVRLRLAAVAAFGLPALGLLLVMKDAAPGEVAGVASLVSLAVLVLCADRLSSGAPTAD